MITHQNPIFYHMLIYTLQIINTFTVGLNFAGTINGISDEIFSYVAYLPNIIFELTNFSYCDLIAHTVLLYVLFCLIYMYCTLHALYILHTVHCTYYTYCTLYAQYMFPVSLFPMLRFHLQHLFTTLVHTLIQVFICCTALN